MYCCLDAFYSKDPMPSCFQPHFLLSFLGCQREYLSPIQNWILLPSGKVLYVPSSSAHFQGARHILERPLPHPVVLDPLNTCVHPSQFFPWSLENKTSLKKDLWDPEGNYIVTKTMKNGREQDAVASVSPSRCPL